MKDVGYGEAKGGKGLKRHLRLIQLLALIVLLACSSARFRTYENTKLSRDSKQTETHSVVLFIGDGMGVEIISIGKIFSEISLGAKLNLVSLANSGTSGYVTTHSASGPVTDSAASGTAIATGSKTANGMIGMSPDSSVVENIFELAVREGMSVGVVTTTSVTDATPASFLAHVPAREMQPEIAEQIVEGDASVVLGGGFWYFLPPDSGMRDDGRDLLEIARQRGFDVVFDRNGLLNFHGDRILGLFSRKSLPFERSRLETEIPSLGEMTQVALDVLSKDPDGFILVVEGGRIDHAEHDNSISDAIGEFFAFDDAIGRAMDFQTRDSLVTIVVTADHDCGGPGITGDEYGYPSYDDLESLVSEQCPIVQWTSGFHTGSMVPVFASGPGNDLFAGIQDNTDIYRKIRSILQL